MFGKAGLAVAVVIAGVTAVHSINLRKLYNQMYPVSTLKRDTLNLCHEADPAFIRAMKEDRDACYRGMPHAIAVALGMVRPDDALAGLFSPWGQLIGAGPLAIGPELAAWVEERRPLLSAPRIAAAQGPCPAPAGGGAAITTQTALDALDGRPGAAENRTLAQLGLVPRPATAAPLPAPGTRPVAPRPAVATLPAGGQSGDRLTLLDTAPAADLGDAGLTSDPPATRCSAPI